MTQPRDTDSRPPSNPRAFAQASGFVFQIVGWFMVLGGCFIGPALAAILGPGEIVYHTPREWWSNSPPNQRLLALNIILLGVAGLALAVLGLGLSHERRGSATGCVLVTGLMAISWWSCTIAVLVLARDFPKIALLIINLLIALGVSVLFVMALTSLRVMRLYPPPPDEPVSREFLEQLDRRRRRMEDA